MRGEEEFVDKPSALSEHVFVFGVIAVILTFIVAFFVCYGAARLSWCYNTFYGEPTGTKIIFSTLCFFFPNLYYPFYSLFLDPVCGRTAQRGGRRQV